MHMTGRNCGTVMRQSGVAEKYLRYKTREEYDVQGQWEAAKCAIRVTDGFKVGVGFYQKITSEPLFEA